MEIICFKQTHTHAQQTHIHAYRLMDKCVKYELKEKNIQKFDFKVIHVLLPAKFYTEIGVSYQISSFREIS